MFFSRRLSPPPRGMCSTEQWEPKEKAVVSLAWGVGGQSSVLPQEKKTDRWNPGKEGAGEGKPQNMWISDPFRSLADPWTVYGQGRQILAIAGCLNSLPGISVLPITGKIEFRVWILVSYKGLINTSHLPLKSQKIHARSKDHIPGWKHLPKIKHKIWKPVLTK